MIETTDGFDVQFIATKTNEIEVIAYNKSQSILEKEVVKFTTKKTMIDQCKNAAKTVLSIARMRQAKIDAVNVVMEELSDVKEVDLV